MMAKACCIFVTTVLFVTSEMIRVLGTTVDLRKSDYFDQNEGKTITRSVSRAQKSIINCRMLKTSNKLAKKEFNSNCQVELSTPHSDRKQL